MRHIETCIFLILLIGFIVLGGYTMYQINTTDWHGGVKAIMDAQRLKTR